ncbi:Hint domain-containing protein [Primorskyibacter sp. 2E233]|uniref:Hint domain-containing protein n=1 Tax=Primorskyibacter sp. 2E233 TaxID=3413431 RepID=UPI003BF1C44E
MTFDINAIDNQFAVSTGSNVGIVPGKSKFDNPPNGSQNLIITTQDGDTDPRLFEVGDTYDVAWGGSGGGGSIANATVVRSDPAPGGGGIIVFEGLDENGNLAEVIWTPDHDLENWYWTNYNPSAEPQFYTTDQDAGYNHEFVCFERSTRIATPRGLIPAGRLKVGQTVCTWMGIKQEIRWIGRKVVPAMTNAAPIRFAPGSIGNFAPVKLSPQHRVMIASPWAELHYGASEVLVPAISLVNGDTIRQVPRKQVDYVHILLDRHDLVIAEGAPCESLLPGFRTQDCLTAEDRAAIKAAIGEKSREPVRPILRRSLAEYAVYDRHTPKREEVFL